MPRRAISPVPAKAVSAGVPTYVAALWQSRAQHAVGRAYLAYLASHNLTLPDWILLGMLSRTPRMTHVAIACDLDVTPTMATKQVNHLEALGLIERTTHQEDYRVKLVSLTEKGRSLAKKVEPQLAKRIDQLFSGLDRSTITAYTAVLAHLAQIEPSDNFRLPAPTRR